MSPQNPSKVTILRGNESSEPIMIFQGICWFSGGEISLICLDLLFRCLENVPQTLLPNGGLFSGDIIGDESHGIPIRKKSPNQKIITQPRMV